MGKIVNRNELGWDEFIVSGMIESFICELLYEL